jgi:hypothetical protein
VTGDQPSVIAVILNTNRREDTLACLASLKRGAFPGLDIIVLDNASTDGSQEAIRRAYPDVSLLPLTDNRGYAGNNNAGVAAALDAGADWVLVLNEDVEVAPDCVERLVATGESDPRVGMVGPLIYHHSEPERIQSAGVELGSWWESHHLGKDEADRGQFAEPRPVQALSGCALLVRAAAIRDVGPLDERFFYYYEETEWCLRIGRRGWVLLNEPGAHVWHKGVQRDYQPSPSVTYYNTRNHFLMMSKLNAPAGAWVKAWFQNVRTLTSWSVKPRWRHMRQHRDAMWQGTLDFLSGRWGQRPA